jgi:Tol biopolymer transport system component
MNQDGGEQKRLLKNDAANTMEMEPALSPDGTRLAYVAMTGTNGKPEEAQSAIYVAKADGSASEK